MTSRIHNFSAGPAVLPVEVLEEARDNLLALGDTGVGIMEHSHRGKAFLGVYEETEALCRELAGIPDNYHVLFLQGGASTQFFTVPMNFLSEDQTADYLVTGSWAKKAVAEARRFGTINVVGSSEHRNFCYIPREPEFTTEAVYTHYTSNNTIFGTQYAAPPQTADGTLVCDMSSDIFSRPIEVSKHAIIYAGAQKNLGPSGVTLVVIRDDWVQRGSEDLPTMLQYRTHAKHQSMFNTPPTFGIYIMNLVFKWIKAQGGLAALEQSNRAKAQTLYDYLDQSRLFSGTADPDSRSMMNVTFVTGDDDLNAEFLKGAEAAGLSGLKGHRSVGGMRASLYNAFPPAGVDALIDYMRRFEEDHK